jgi:diacylglycerol kinase (ATP)
MSGVGIGGAVCHAVNNSSKWFGGRLTFLYHTVATTLRWRNRRLRYRLDESPDWLEATVYMMVAGNGRYQGGGMKPVPQANMRNGLLDVVVIVDFGLPDLPKIPMVYEGTHVDWPERIYLHRCTRLRVEPIDPTDRVYLETDGETPGMLPAEWRVHPKQVHLVVPHCFLSEHPLFAV